MFARICRLMYQEVLNDAVPVLWFQRRLQLRQQKRQVVLAQHKRSSADDACRGVRHQGVYFKVSFFKIGYPTRHLCLLAFGWLSIFSSLYPIKIKLIWFLSCRVDFKRKTSVFSDVWFVKLRQMSSPYTVSPSTYLTVQMAGIACG